MEIQVIEKTNGRINRETGRGNDNYRKKYPFSSRLYCGFCGSLLTRRNWNADRNCAKVVWQCIKRANMEKKNAHIVKQFQKKH